MNKLYIQCKVKYYGGFLPPVEKVGSYLTDSKGLLITPIFDDCKSLFDYLRDNTKGLYSLADVG